MKQEAGVMTVIADMPGVDEDDIHVELQSGRLHIKADRDFDHDNEDSENYLILERPFGPLERTIEVPANLDASGMSAKYKRGVLKLRIPFKVSKG